MGQEDLFREDPVETRVQNGGTARLVFSTDEPIIGYRIEYSANNRLLDQTLGPITLASAESNIEVFLTPVNVDSLYAFRVIALDEEGEDILTSGVYYFLTGSVISVTPSLLAVNIGIVSATIADQVLSGTLTITGAPRVVPTTTAYELAVALTTSTPDSASLTTTITTPRFDTEVTTE